MLSLVNIFSKRWYELAMLTNTSLEKIIEQDSSSATQMNIIYECNLGHLKSITNWFFHELKINTSVNEFKLFAEECNKKKLWNSVARRHESKYRRDQVKVCERQRFDKRFRENKMKVEKHLSHRIGKTEILEKKKHNISQETRT